MNSQGLDPNPDCADHEGHVIDPYQDCADHEGQVVVVCDNQNNIRILRDISKTLLVV